MPARAHPHPVWAGRKGSGGDGDIISSLNKSRVIGYTMVGKTIVQFSKNHFVLALGDCIWDLVHRRDVY